MNVLDHIRSTQGASSAAACPQELVRAVGAEEVPARLEMAPPGTVLDHRETDHAVRLGAWGRGQLEAECVHVIDQTKNEVELKVLGRMRLAVVVTCAQHLRTTWLASLAVQKGHEIRQRIL